MKGVILRQKFCKLCYIFRPLSSSHCHDCNNCVEKFDHHCPWVGNCIGRNNYKFFFLFLTFLNLLDFYSIFLCLYKANYYINISKKVKNFLKKVKDFNHFITLEYMTFVQLLLCLLVYNSKIRKWYL